MKRLLPLAVALGIVVAAALASADWRKAARIYATNYWNGDVTSSGAVYTGTTCPGDGSIVDVKGDRGCPESADTAPRSRLFNAQDAYPFGTQTAADTIVRGGLDEKKAVVADYTLCAGNKLTVTINGSANDLTEGVTWTAATSNAATALSLQSAVTALTGVDGALSSATVGVYVNPTEATLVGSLSLSTDDATCLTVTNGTDGAALFYGLLRGNDAHGPWLSNVAASGTVPTMGPDRADVTMGLSTASSRLQMLVGGATKLEVGVSDVIIGSTLDTKLRGGVQSDTANLPVEDDLDLFGAGLTKGGKAGLHLAQQSLTFPGAGGAATETTSGLIPDGAVLLGVSVRVTTTATTCTSADVGDGTTADLYADNMGVTATTTITPAQATVSWIKAETAAAEVRVTGVGGNCVSGVFRINAVYLDMTADTSN